MAPNRLLTLSACAFGALALNACEAPGTGTGDDDDATDPGGCAGLELLGCGSHGEDSVVIDLIADSSNGINTPRDLEFHPDRPGELWIAQEDHSLVVLFDAGTADQTERVEDQIGPATIHFYAVPSGLAFSADNGNWASSHETDEQTQGSGGTPFDFMGPTLWTSDLMEYDSAPAHHQHIDMLHNSPNGMGIAWEEENTFWYFDGYHSAITRYAFNNDHGLGGADHSDGITARYIEGDVRWKEGVPSHLEFVHESDELFIADTGNDRIAVLDCASGERGGAVAPNYDGVDQHRVDGADIRTLADGDDVNFESPSGIAVNDEFVFFTDNENSNILAVSRADGSLVDWLEMDVPRDSLMGLEFDPDGNLLVVNYGEDQILRISPKPAE